MNTLSILVNYWEWSKNFDNEPRLPPKNLIFAPPVPIAIRIKPGINKSCFKTFLLNN
jgi:hypothetical protein